MISLKVVNMQFTGGATASLSMIGFTESICAREVNVFGTKVRVGSLTQQIHFLGIYKYSSS